MYLPELSRSGNPHNEDLWGSQWLHSSGNPGKRSNEQCHHMGFLSAMCVSNTLLHIMRSHPGRTGLTSKWSLQSRGKANHHILHYRVQDGSPYIPLHNPERSPSCAPSSLQISGIPQIGSRNTEVKYCDFPKNPSARAYLEKNLDKGVSTKIGKAKGMWFDRGSVKLFLESGTSGKTAQIEEKDEQADNVGEEAGTESP